MQRRPRQEIKKLYINLNNNFLRYMESVRIGSLSFPDRISFWENG